MRLISDFRVSVLKSEIHSTLNKMYSSKHASLYDFPIRNKVHLLFTLLSRKHIETIFN